MIELVKTPIDRGAVLEAVASPEAGAVAAFDGTVRRTARGKEVRYLYYEAYPAMAVKEMAKIRDEALRRFPILDLAIVHRIGRLEIGESSVFIAVSSAHRGDAFQACRFAIDTLKTTVPIWKKEHYVDGEVWIEEYGG